MPDSDQLSTDLFSMVGVWRDRLDAHDPFGSQLSDDPFGGAPGSFPFENLVYVDFDGTTYTQTNVVLSGRADAQRTFTATVADGQLTFDKLGPEAPSHVGVSAGPGLIWFVSADIGAAGVSNYCEPDLIRIDGDRRFRDTVLWRNRDLVRTLHVEGELLSRDSSTAHLLDPRGGGAAVHGDRSVTQHYKSSHDDTANQESK